MNPESYPNTPEKTAMNPDSNPSASETDPLNTPRPLNHEGHGLEAFTDRLLSTLDALIQKQLAAKDEKNKFLTYENAMATSAAVRNIFRNSIGKVPPEIEAALQFSEAVLSPSSNAKRTHIRRAASILGLGGGFWMLLRAAAVGLGWGSGALAAVKAWLFGCGMTGPIGWAAGGATILLLGGYFLVTDDQASNTENYRNTLSSGLRVAVSQIWGEHGKVLSTYGN